MSLLALSAAAVLSAGAAAPTPYLLAWRGDAEAARAALDLKPGELPKDAGALLVLACLELEAGRFDAAAAAAARLEVVEPGTSESRVLSRLVTRRRAYPAERMSDALIEAWKSAGSPEVGVDAALGRLLKGVPEGEDLVPVPSAKALASLSPGEAFLFAGLTSPFRGSVATDKGFPDAMKLAMAERDEQAKALLAKPGARTVALNLALYAWSGGRADQGLLRTLAAQRPNDGWVALELALPRGTETTPLDEATISAIQVALGKARLTPASGAVFEELVRIARRLDPVHPEVLAWSVLWGNVPIAAGVTRLGQRAQITKNPEVQTGAREVLEGAAAVLGRDPTILGRMVGAIAASSAARLGGDAAAARAAGGRKSAWRTSLEAAESALREQAWPLPSLRREWHPNLEMDRAERLVGPFPD